MKTLSVLFIPQDRSDKRERAPRAKSAASMRLWTNVHNPHLRATTSSHNKWNDCVICHGAHHHGVPCSPPVYGNLIILYFSPSYFGLWRSLLAPNLFRWKLSLFRTKKYAPNLVKCCYMFRQRNSLQRKNVFKALKWSNSHRKRFSMENEMLFRMQ